jgi:hypothetical protein
MMTCRSVAFALSTGDVEMAPIMVRLSVRLHLAMCRSCRAFRRHLSALGALARKIRGTYDAEPSDDFEARITDTLVGRR